MALFTCSFAEYERMQSDDRLPVRTTVGAPRRAPSYGDEMVVLREVTPRRQFVFPTVLPYERYVQEYRKMLDQISAKLIAQRIATLTRNSGRPDLVLLCFDKLWTPSDWCHRTMFADWWVEQTGEEVTELGRQYVPPTGGTAEDPTLFDDIQGGS